MAHPLVTVEHAVRYFITQWLNGQQPSLILKTHTNGEIFVRCEVKCAGVSVKNQERASLHHRKSGQFSRIRRRDRRSKSTNNSEISAASLLEDKTLNIQKIIEEGTILDVEQNTGNTNEEDSNQISTLSEPSLKSNLANSNCVKKPKLTVCVQESLSLIPDEPILSTTKLEPISVLPMKAQLSNLSIHSVQNTSIPPKAIFHPAIIRASLSMFKKKPDSLTAEELNKFNLFIKWKLHNGEPIEEDILYNPAGGNMNCLHCDRPT